MAAKRTGELIPLCHPLGLDGVELALDAGGRRTDPDRGHGEGPRADGRRDGGADGRSVAALTVYDMCKAVDRGMVIDQIQLEEKTGGRRGHLPIARAPTRPAEASGRSP